MNIEITMTPVNVFYYKCKFQAHDQIRSKLLHQIETTEIDDTHKNKSISKVDWASSTVKNRDWITTILDPLTTYMSVIGSAAGYKTPLITDIWFQQYEQSNIHDWHIHGQQFVGVYYLELPETSPKTQYINSITGEIIDFDVREGDILVFPSSLVHRAPLMEDESRKTIISWNFNFNEPIIREHNV